MLVALALALALNVLALGLGLVLYGLVNIPARGYAEK